MKKKQPLLYLVDDQKIVNFVNQKVIENAGVACEMLAFEDPREALVKLTDLVPDYILLDIQMPEVNGWQFLESLQRQQCRSKVVMVTSSTSPLDRKRAASFDAVVDYIVKPLSVEEVQKLSQQHCSH
ncbi:response regulator [Altibacter sp. HG106]|uniref:response regulator n=1 Tax=Altibacter sp. HG106 TaxID=3023937 RepID=UPI00235086B1|nr:response regulator [Altibacter sp. HG106]MDC7996256.1 response regulator [Altibacter sp. HG106]